MRIAIIGNNDGPERLAAALKETEHEVVLLAVQKNARPQVQEVVGSEQSLADRLADLDVDLLVNCFANFKYTFLHHQYLVLNVHLAPLPKYRGRHPLQWALINGESTYGVTIHQINDDWDDGPIYWQKLIDVEEGWSAVELREALFHHVENEFADLINNLPNIKPRRNPAGEGSYLPRRNPADSLITDWSDRDHVYRKVRALRDDHNPAFGILNDQKLVFIDAFRLNIRAKGHPGAIFGVSTRNVLGIAVATGDEQSILLTLRQTDPIPDLSGQFTTQP